MRFRQAHKNVTAMPPAANYGANDEEDSIPLRSLNDSPNSANSSDLDHLLSDDVSEASSSDLPPVDGGRGAWTFLLGCWLVEAMIWGFPLAFGIFQSTYAANELFKESNSVPTIGTLATGVSYLGMPFTNPVALKWPQHRKKMCVFGWLLCLVGLLGASLATQVWQLLLFQGLLYGTGWVICYTPFLFMLNDWFVERRGLAYGLLFGASGVSGLVIPAAVGWLLEKFGFRTALRIYAIATIVISGPALFLIRPRATATKQSPHHYKSPQNGGLQTLRPFLTNLHFMLFALAIFLQGLGFFIPNIFIPSYTTDLNLSHTSGSGLLALISLSQVCGQFFQGWVSDKVNVYIPASVSALLPGLGALFLWGPAKGMAFLVPFAIIWGFFSASYSVLYTRICSLIVAGKDGESSTGEEVAMLMYGVFSFERGVSNVLEGPISSWLLRDNDVDVGRYGLGRYADVVWFTSACMVASSLVGAGWFWTRSRERQ